MLSFDFVFQYLEPKICHISLKVWEVRAPDMYIVLMHSLFSDTRTGMIELVLLPLRLCRYGKSSLAELLNEVPGLIREKEGGKMTLTIDEQAVRLTALK